MPKYRKKPVVIEARKVITDTDSASYDTNSPFALARWIESEGQKAAAYSGNLHIHTLEGVMSANSGDYVIRGVQGEFYPCKPDIFEATYEPVPEVGGSRRAGVIEQADDIVRAEQPVRALAADIKAIANGLMDEGDGPLPLNELARRLIHTGRVHVTPPITCMTCGRGMWPGDEVCCPLPKGESR